MEVLCDPGLIVELARAGVTQVSVYHWAKREKKYEASYAQRSEDETVEGRFQCDTVEQAEAWLRARVLGGPRLVLPPEPVPWVWVLVAFCLGVISVIGADWWIGPVEWRMRQ